jgi:putative endonuclease
VRPCVYILASDRNGTLYVGVTSALPDRIQLHKQDVVEGFTKRYGVHRLVYYEMHETMVHAIRREKRLKKWNRAWKLRLIEQMNPDWRDLFDEHWGAIRAGPGDIDRQRFR